MNLHELTSDNVKTLDVEQLEQLHRGVHRAARVSDEYELLIKSHELLSAEQARRGIEHNTPLDMPKPSPNAIYLKSPHGTLIAEGKKRAIAKSHPIRGMEGKRIIVSKENGVGLAFGTAIIGTPEAITEEEFDKRFDEHRVTSKERNRWWKGISTLYLYPLLNFIPYETPRTVEVPAGVQTLMQDVKFIDTPGTQPPDLLQLSEVPTITKEEQIMPWKPSDATRHTQAADTPKKKRQWASVANSALKRCVAKGGSTKKCEASAIRQANSVVKGGKEKHVVQFSGETPWDAIVHHHSLNIVEEKSFLDFCISEGISKEDTLEVLSGAYLEWEVRVNIEQRQKLIGQAEAIIDEVLDSTDVIDTTTTVDTTQRVFTDDQMKAAEPSQTTCTCPNCKEVAEHESGTPCREVKCTNCGAMMRGGGDDNEKSEDTEILSAEVIQAIADIVHAKMQSEQVEEKVIAETEPEAPESPPEQPRDIVVQEKAGRRVRKDKLTKLKDLFQQLKDLIGWAAYEDEIEKLVLPVAKAFKGRDGRTWLMLWTTNSYLDRDKEIFRIKAIHDYVDRYANNPIKGEFQFWHVGGTKFGDIVWQAVVADRFLVQMGTFDDTPVGNAFKDFLTAHPDSHPVIAPTGWGASHGYNYVGPDRADGVYDWFNTVESSVLPMVYAANLHNPNPLVLGGKEMDEKQTDALRVISEEIGVDLVEIVEKTGQQKKAEIDDLVEHKSTEGAETETPKTEPTESEPEVTKSATEELQTSEEGEETPPDVKAIAESVVTEVSNLLQLESLSDAIKTIQDQGANVASAITELTNRVAQLEQSDEKKVADRMETMPRLSWFRASQSKETVLNPDDKLTSAAPARQGPVLPIPRKE